MVTLPVLAVLLCNLVLFLGGGPRLGNSSRQSDGLLLCALFFCSGMPALVYQVVWQRVLFSIYGVNAESVAVIVSAFMLGLGLGSLLGGWLSSRFPDRVVIVFGVSELGVAAFGLASLRIFHWAAGFSAGASLPATIVFGLALLLFPTVLMGTTLPLLVQRFVQRSNGVGFSVSILYFVNTFGSAVACYLCAMFLLRDAGESGAIKLAAGTNALVGVTAFLFGRYQSKGEQALPGATEAPAKLEKGLPLGVAMLIAGVSGFIALGFEIAWFRVFLLASRDRAPTFALMLSTVLAGIAAGSFISEQRTAKKEPEEVVRIVGLLLMTAGAASVYLPPLVALLRWKGISFFQWTPLAMQARWQTMWFLLTAPAFFAVSALIGSVMPLVCRLAVSSGSRAGRGVSWTYGANIFGSTLGSLLIGFVWMNRFGLKQVSLHLGVAAAITGAFVLLLGRGTRRKGWSWALAFGLAIFLALAVASPTYAGLLEKLILGPGAYARGPFVRVVENRNGVVAVTRDGTVFGNAVYDGAFNVDPTNDVNHVDRIYALSFFHPAPRRILMIGLSSGSWAQILANHPQLESMDIVEINPGYLRLIPVYPCVASLLQNPRVHIYVDDGRRWLLAHPEAHYDFIAMNTSFFWRDHSSDLLSVDFLKIVRPHLDAGGVFLYNTTGSEDVIATGLSVYPYGLRVLNFLAVSDAPLDFSEARWMSVLQQYRIDNRPQFDGADPKAKLTLADYASLVRQMDRSTQFQAFETSRAMSARLGGRLIITDDNMGLEWKDPWGNF